MARISLRAYNRDIEAMIDGGQIDEAFAHSRYILERFPKHIDTYRLMGKALLEAQRFGDASDVFHRVLSSVPDDFIAHLGMSIIREDESNLDAAIWHMERSLEVQPSNAAVQVELRRLYGLRDGLTPQKIQLTRGALARMSAKSNLYTQAITELRSALSNDPQRPDLLVVLAEMYAQTGARMEAVETCNSLISKLPYCLVANQILAEILPDTEHAERAQEFKERLVELNPYYAQISPVAPTIEQVPDGAVTIERYEYPGEGIEAVQAVQPEWAASLGVKIDEEVDIEEETPDWLKDEEQEITPVSSSEDQAEFTSEDFPEIVNGEDDQLSGEEEELPDWMKSTDYIDEEGISAAPITKIEQDPELDASEELSDSSLPEGGISKEAETAPEPIESQESEPLPDWMMEAETLEEDETPTKSTESVDEESEKVQDLSEEALDSEIETPEWLHEAMAESQDDESHLSTAVGVGAAAGMAALLSDDDQEGESLGQEDSSDLEFEEDVDSAEPVLLAEEHLNSASTEGDEEPVSPVEDAAIEDEELAASGVAGATALSGTTLSGDDEQDEGADFETEEAISESFIEDSGIVTDDLSAGDDQSDADIPDWLQDLGEDIGESPDTPEEPALQDEPTLEEEAVTPLPVPEIQTEEPEPVLEFPIEGDDATGELSAEAMSEPEELATEFTDAIPDWLSEVSPEGIPDLITQDESTDDDLPDIVKAEIPDWLRKMEQEHKAELAAAGEPEIAQGLEFDSDVTDLAGEDVPSWLMSAMETELPGEPIEISEVEDIGEIISDEGLEDEIAIEEEITLEPEVDEEITPEMEPVEAMAAAAIAAEIISADEEHEIDEAVIEPEEAGEAKEIEEEPEVDVVVTEPVETAEDVLEPTAEMGPTDDFLVEGDTQPIAVGIQEGIEDDEFISEVEEPAPISVEDELGDELEPAQIGEEDIAEHDIQVEEELPFPAEVSDEVPSLAEDEPLAPEDEDAAMAWLESLAAKQGAAEEELLTAPEDRLDEPPEWVQEVAAEDESLVEAEQDEKVDTAAAAALAGLAAGAILSDKDQEGIPEEEISEALETTSDWVPEVADEVSELPEIEIEEETPTVEEEIKGVDELDVQPEPEAEEVTPIVDFQAESGEETVSTPEAEVVEEQIAEESLEEIPDWLSGLGEEEEIEVEPAPEEWTPTMLVVDESVTDVVKEPKETKIDLNAASLSQLERIPGIGFIHAQRILEYRNQAGAFKSLDELEKVHGLTPDMVKEIKNHLTVEVVVEAAPPVSSHPDLQGAWTSITDGEIQVAVDQYAELINRDEHLDEVIRDLQEALVKYPQDASLYQSLGDAYMHSNMLDEALDAYNRAEDLIQ